MSAASDLVTQFMGAGMKRGWSGLRPHPDPKGTVWSVFLGRALAADEGQTLIEAIGTVVHETTLRIKPYRQGVQKDVPETVLGHAAGAHGTALDNAAISFDIREQNKQILEMLKRIEAK
jgi:hypothetical protein